jgi:uncharacterized alpha-E superfamily protein
MTMLSRVAERLYWMARYLERAEGTARLVRSFSHLVMDIPEGSELGWDVLVRILDADPAFQEHYRAYNEQNVLKFLIADTDNFSSIRSAVKAARENVRTTRDVLPAEAWEAVNELYIYVEEWADKSVGRRNRYKFLEMVISRCQMIDGLLLTTIPRDHAYRFIKLGDLLERSDMTTRIIDVGVAAIMEREAPNPSVDPLLWGSLLEALSAMGSYRRHVGPIAEGNPVVDFMFKDAELPRSVAFCLNGIREELKPLKRSKDAIAVLDRARRRVSRFASVRMPRARLHDMIDELQLNFAELHDAINQTWFMPEKP